MVKNTKLIIFAALALVSVFVFTADSCSGDGNSAGPTAVDKSVAASKKLQSSVYQSKNNIEFRNYNLRQRLADNQSSILWCTFFPPTVGQEPFTVPVAGKLTSSNKRPYDSTRYVDAGNYAWYQKEVPGPDHMFGSSSEYRYGFDPTLSQYSDFTDMASYCTSTPTVWQANKTNVIVKTAPTLVSIDKAAQKALKSGDAAGALKILQGAESK